MINNNISEKIALLSDTAEFLNDKSYVMQLNRLRDSLESGTYMLSVMGQFSAGKSALINNILEKDILPVHITETTALITFICYGEDEHAELIMNDSSVERLDFESTVNLWQSGELSSKLDDADILYLFVNSELLKNGLIIADTPGINTMIKKHVSLSADIVKRSDSVLYVMGKSIIETDLNFICGIIADGLDITFVRTHMDALKSFEENADITMTKERKILSEYTNRDIFFVSNEKDSNYYSEIQKLRNFISKKIAYGFSATEENALRKTEFIAHKFKEMLLEKSNVISISINGEKHKFDEKKAQIEKSLNEMENILSVNKNKLKEKFEQTQKNAEDDIRESCKNISKNISHLIDCSDGTERSDYGQKIQSLVSRGCADLRSEYMSYFDKITAGNVNSINEAFSKIENAINIDTDIPETLEEAAYEFDEITEEKKALMTLCEEIQEEIENISAETELSNKQEQELTERSETLRSALETAKETLANYSEYKTQYIETQAATHSGERGWRTVGKILDWATLAIPGDAIVKGAAKALQIGAKGINAAGKAGKVANALNKGADILTSGAKAAKIIDAGIDAGKIIRIENDRGRKIRDGKARAKRERKIQHMAEQAKNYQDEYKKVRGTLNELKEDTDTASFLDYLTIEHWFAQIGKKFDTPQHLEIDREYEELYYRQRSELQQQIEIAATEECNNTAKLLDIKDKKELAKLKEDKLKRQLANNKAKFDELDRNEQKERKKAQEKAVKAYYSSEAERILDNYCSNLLTESAFEINNLIECYICSYDYSICHQINKKRAELETFEKTFISNNKENLKTELDKCSEYLHALNDIF